MSSYQPPGGQQPPPQGPPAYAPPQDPWAGGFEQGLASVPTDPIPQEQYGQFGPGGEAWSQQTVPHGGQYPYVQQPRRSRAGLLTVIFLAIIVLGGGGGYATYYLVKTRTGTATTTPPIQSSAGSAAAAAWDPHKVKTGDCLINNGTATNPDVRLSVCTAANTFTVVKVKTGADIPEGANNKFDDSTSLAECGDTPSQNWYGYKDDHDPAKDVFLCLARNGTNTGSPSSG